MTRIQPTFTFGIEEEFYLVERATRDLAADTPPELVAALEAALGGQFSTEFMRSQIEVATTVCRSMTQARRQLLQRRNTIARVAEEFDLAPIAASTHPFARWNRQRHRNTPRYNSIAESFQGVGRRMVANGLHVHVGIEDNDLRIAVMNRLRAFLPVLLALSTSSPFWQREDTGLKSFRIAINDATPRKGIPEYFAGWAEFQAAIGLLQRARVLDDATQIWWDLRPSVRFPTLEMRITDMCPLVDDAICVAALFRCLCRYCFRELSAESLHGRRPLLLINENRWRAARYGIAEGQLDLQTGDIIDFHEVMEDVLELIHDDAAYFDCVAEVAHALTIVRRGTSAERQLALHRELIDQGLTIENTLVHVVDMLVEETASDAAMSSKPTLGAEPFGDGANP